MSVNRAASDTIAAAWTEAPGRMTARQALLLYQGAVAVGMDNPAFARLVVAVTGADQLDQLDQAGFDAVMDCLVVMGFRHPTCRWWRPGNSRAWRMPGGGRA